MTTRAYAPIDPATGVVPIAELATGTPTGSKFIRDDGVLAVPPGTGVSSAGPDADVTIDTAGAAGTAGTFARSAHGHKLVTTDAPSGANVTVDAAATAAATGAIARATHGHRLNTYSSVPAAIGTAAAGTSGDAPARGSHVHPTGAGTPSTQAFDDAAATGSGPAAAMTDHKHAMPAAAITSSGHTMATARLLGRSTAATGAIEEISAGTGLSLAAGVLSATGAGAISTVDATLSGNVTMTTANTFYDGPSASFAAGTWLVMFKMLIQTAGTSVHQYTAKLWDGTTVYDSSQNDAVASANGHAIEVTGMAIVTLGSTTTLKVSVTDAFSANQTLLRDPNANSPSHHSATRLVGIKTG